jgi:maleylpyruvate isomerase
MQAAGMSLELPPTGALVSGATASHQRLSTTLDGLTDDMARRPSLLPDWTVGHVLTHIARNAESHIGMLEGALAGERRLQYPGGNEQRAADIEAGSDRQADDLVADVQSTCERLEAVWARMTKEAWDAGGLFTDGTPWPAPLIVFHRWREVEIHHADLGLGYRPEDWPEEYVAAELPRQLAVLPDRLDGDRRRHLMAWLFGREPQPELGPLATDGRMFRV